MNDESTERLTLLAQSIAERSDMLLLTDQPQTLLAQLRTTNSPPPGQIDALATTDVAADMSILGDRRWPLVCLLEPDIDKPCLIRLLARIRDLHADRVIHISNTRNNNTCGWALADSLALGFSQIGKSVIAEQLDESELQIFEFDIRNYKPAPDWLNAKNWANPERWDKHRW